MSLTQQLTKEELEAIQAQFPEYLKALKTRYWWPQQGRQFQAAKSKADVLLFGGAAGGGKSNLLCGLALTDHRNSVIYRKEATQLGGLFDEIAGMVNDERKGFNSKTLRWNIPDGRVIDFGSVSNKGDEQKYQGRPHDLIGYDELTHFSETQFRFLMAWNRSTIRGQRCRVVCASNPPTGGEGKWVIQYWKPWLDPNHPNPAAPGELRWFISYNGKDQEVEGAAPVNRDGEIIYPQSRTFIPSLVGDNAYLAGTNYLSTLQALPEPLRSQLLYGDFLAGAEDQSNQVIPTDWVDAAMNRWQPRSIKGQLSAVGVDPSRGGRDLTVIACRHKGFWFDELTIMEGMDTKTGGQVSQKVLNIIGSENPAIAVDANGIGSSVYDHLVPYMGDNVEAILGQNSPRYDQDATGILKYVNLRAEQYWSFREMLDPTTGLNIALPKDEELKADLTAPTFKLTARGLQIEGKDDIIRRLKRSPDRADAIIYAANARVVFMRN